MPVDPESGQAERENLDGRAILSARHPEGFPAVDREHFRIMTTKDLLGDAAIAAHRPGATSGRPGIDTKAFLVERPHRRAPPVNQIARRACAGGPLWRPVPPLLSGSATVADGNEHQEMDREQGFLRSGVLRCSARLVADVEHRQQGTGAPPRSVTLLFASCSRTAADRVCGPNSSRSSATRRVASA